MRQYEILDSTGKPVGEIPFTLSEGVSSDQNFSIRIANQGDESSPDLRLAIMLVDRTFGSGTNLNGFEVMQEKWIEAKIGAGSWVPIGGDPSISGNYFTVPSPVCGEFVTVDLRWNIPSGVETKGDLACSLELFFKVEA